MIAWIVIISFVVALVSFFRSDTAAAGEAAPLTGAESALHDVLLS